MGAFIPYCGDAPRPGTEVWNLDPPLLLAFGITLLTYFAVTRRTRVSTQAAFAFFAGWSLLGLAFISPLCNLSVALFSARVGQHMVVALLAAPLIAAGVAPLFPRASSGFLWMACVAFFVVMWVWHSPGAYDLTLRNNYVYWLMHVTTIAAALALWRALLSAESVQAFLAASLTGVQMSLLGAILTFAKNPLFDVHALTTTAWGLSQMQDQQLGGLVMWIPAGLLLTLYSIAALGLALRRMDAAGKAVESKYAI